MEVPVCACRPSIRFDPPTGVDAPLDRTQLCCQLVVVGINVDLSRFEQLSKCPIVLCSSVDETLFVDPVVRNDRQVELEKAINDPPPTPGTSTTAETQSFLSFSASMSRMVFTMCPVVVIVSAL
jgi:hypothetical protein